MNTHRTLIWTTAFLALAVGSAYPQVASGPRMGFVVEAPGQTVQPVLGVPGAAVVGAALDIGRGLSPVAASPRGDYVLALAGDARQPSVWLPGGEVRTLSAAVAAPDEAVLSPEGTAAAFYYNSARLFLLISGLPDAPALAATIQMNPSRAPFSNFAVSDDGMLLLAIDGSAAAVLGSVGDLNRLTLPGGIEAAAFAANSHDAVVAGAGQAQLIRSVEKPGEAIPLPVAGLSHVSAAAISPDGKIAFFAGAAAGKVVAVTVGNNPNAVVLDCPCQPDRLVRLNDESSYRLAAYSGGSLYLLDGASQTPRIVVAGPAIKQEQ